jgi:hypothetical protein
MNAAALAIRMLIPAYRLLIQIPEKLALIGKAAIRRNELNRVFAGRHRAQFLKEPSAILAYTAQTSSYDTQP